MDFMCLPPLPFLRLAKAWEIACIRLLELCRRKSKLNSQSSLFQGCCFFPSGEGSSILASELTHQFKKKTKWSGSNGLEKCYGRQKERGGDEGKNRDCNETAIAAFKRGRNCHHSVLLEKCNVMQGDNWKMYVSTSCFVACSPALNKPRSVLSAWWFRGPDIPVCKQKKWSH